MVLAAAILSGCKTAPREDTRASDARARQAFVLRSLSFERCRMFLTPLGLGRVEEIPDVPKTRVIRVEGTPDQLKKVRAILDVVDSHEEYCIETLGPVSSARTLPLNGHIAMALGDIDVGTFDELPINDGRARALIDVQGGSVLAFLPVRYRDRLWRLLAGDNNAALPQERAPARDGADRRVPGTLNDAAFTALPTRATPQAIASSDATAGVRGDDRRQGETSAGPTAEEESAAVVTLVEMGSPADANTRDDSAESSARNAESDGQLAKTVRVRLNMTPRNPAAAQAKAVTEKAGPANGEDLLTMTLPETITVTQLLDLVGKWVGLNYVYDPKEIVNQPISLKLHGILQGDLKIKHLYAVLETVLDFMNLAMIRREGNLVAIVPMEKALQTLPEFVDENSEGVQVGDTVVTRVFNIQYVDVEAVIRLLQNMKLSVAATSMDNANVLLVTCHAGRMNRVEQLVQMIDCPGRAPECRFRRLSYTRATPVIAKIRTLAQELEGITVAAAPSPESAKAATPAAKPPAAPKPAEIKSKGSVYLDADERTNRILMIGFEEELTLMEELVDILDVAQEDPRTPHIYALKHVDAQQAVDKLQKLEVLKASSGGPDGPGTRAAGDLLAGEPLVAVLETTNQLVVKAAPDQHARIREFLTYIDVVPADARTIAAYQIRHIDVHVAKETLEQLDLVSAEAGASSFVPGPNQPAKPQRSLVPITPPAGSTGQKVPIVVSESTNTLLVKATPEQHTRIAAILRHIDRYSPQEQWIYQVYPLESSSPGHLATLLERLIQETTKDKEGKIEKIVPKTAEQIAIVPDPNTYSLIVYANQKSQKWIEGLINRLDKRRPQVLIDVTLVEITRTDSFEYDLSVVGRADGAVAGNIVVDPVQTITSGSRLEGGFNLHDGDGNPTGGTKAFYNDEHVQALLTAIQRKNYGRVLAKPKVLVDDGRKGQIVTTDTTTYVKESIQIPQTGTPITTRDFVPIEASIELQITPHVSEGNLLRLDVYMSRDDFGARPLSGAPPDKATSEVTTTVFVPDDRTVILGGLVKLNQSKGGSKVPLLGDIPVVGVIFRTINNNDIEKKLYVFLKANIVRPYDDYGLVDLQKISEEHREAFEQSESAFQEHEAVPGVTPEPMQPEGVLRDYK